MYVSDYDDRYPIAWEGGSGTGMNWATLIYPYVKNIQIYNCPSTTNVAYYQDPRVGGYGINQKVRGHDYHMNGCLGHLGGGPGCREGTWPPIKQASVHRPAEMIMLKESWYAGHFYAANPDLARDYCTADCDQGWQGTYSPAHHPGTATRHNDGSNVSYLDGHARWLSQGELYAEVAAPAVRSIWSNTP